MGRGWALFGVVALAVWISGAAAAASDKTVAEEILDILRANNQITEQQYDELLEKARGEGQAIRSAEAEKRPETFRLYWKEGIRLDSNDKRFRIKLGGRLQTDFAIFDEEADVEDLFGEIGSGTEFRRARLYVEGLIYELVKFKAQYDFAGGDADFKDAYLELQKLPWVGHVRVGHFKEPFSLEELTSSKYITFMERSIANFAPARNTGLMVHNHALGKRLSWAVGAFRETDDFGEGFGEDSEYNVTARLTGLPWYEEEGRKLLHVGLSYSHKFRNNDNVRFRRRPEAHLAPRFVDTGNFPADGVDLFTPEIALILGPFSLQAEYSHALSDAVGGSDPDFSGFYVAASYFLSDEHRPYKGSSGSFSRLKPTRNFDGKGSWGAWEVGLRYSHVDLNDSGISGGRLSDITAGLNWYLNPNVRVMLNYVFADLDDVGDTNIFETRFQVDF